MLAGAERRYQAGVARRQHGPVRSAGLICLLGS